MQRPQSFKTDPPNAVLSMFEEDAVNSAVVELFDPKLEAATLTYRVKVLSGAIPSEFTEATLFVDRWGRGAAFVGGAMMGGVVGHATAQPKTTTVVTQPATVCNVFPPESPAPAPAQKTVEQQITELNNLAQGGYITPEEYKAKKQAIINSI